MARTADGFVAERLTKSATFEIQSPIELVFPLFGPIREKDWAYGWNPNVIYPVDSLVTDHMVFTTRGGVHGTDEKYTWSVVKYSTAMHLIEYLISTNDRLWFITVECKDAESKTRVQVTYSYTGLSEAGNEKNRVEIGKMFESDLKDWQEAINHYLKTGKQLR